MAFHSRVLVTGSEGFTGIHLRKLFEKAGLNALGLIVTCLIEMVLALK